MYFAASKTSEKAVSSTIAVAGSTNASAEYIPAANAPRRNRESRLIEAPPTVVGVRTSQIILHEKNLPVLPVESRAQQTQTVPPHPRAVQGEIDSDNDGSNNWNPIAGTINLVSAGASTIVSTISSYCTTQTRLKSFPASIPPNSNTIAIYNDGELLIPSPNSQSSPIGPNVVIYNGARGKLAIAPAAPKPETINCPRCSMRFEGSVAAERHQESKPEFCRVHGMCISSWEEHNAVSGHRRCGVLGCVKESRDFGSDERYRRHFKKKHAVG